MLRENTKGNTQDPENTQILINLLNGDQPEPIHLFLENPNFSKNMSDKEKQTLSRLCNALTTDKAQPENDIHSLLTQIQKYSWSNTILVNKLKKYASLLQDANDQLNTVLQHRGTKNGDRPNRLRVVQREKQAKVEYGTVELLLNFLRG
jgi:hypothetical protein